MMFWYYFFFLIFFRLFFRLVFYRLWLARARSYSHTHAHTDADTDTADHHVYADECHALGMRTLLAVDLTCCASFGVIVAHMPSWANVFSFDALLIETLQEETSIEISKRTR